MRLLDRYLLRELLIWLGFCLGGLIILVVAFDLISSLNRIQEHQLLVKDVVELYLVKIPRILVFIIPITLLIALLFALTQHTRNNELVAMRAAGVSLWRISLPYLVVGFLFSVAVFAMNELLVPDSQSKEDEIMNRRTQKSPASTQTTAGGFANARDSRSWSWDNCDFETGVMTNPNVDWIEHGQQWTLIARRAQYTHGIWTFFGSANFSSNDFSAFDAFASKLKQPTNSLTQFLSLQLSPATQTILARQTNGAELQRAVTADLNRIVRLGPLYDTARFAGMKLPPELIARAGEKKRGTELVLLNRELVIESFPGELLRTTLDAVTLSRKGNPPTQTITNELAMPQFSETPHNFAVDAKFSARFKSLDADSVSVPILEILDYQKLHPDLSQKNKWWLNTQLQGRFAEPWQSLIVVLIAIPFGAASGRRNIFMGVAGSIVLVFVYFILFRLGLALGTGGLVPAWIAAWMPNIVFGIAGVWMMLRVR